MRFSYLAFMLALCTATVNALEWTTADYAAVAIVAPSSPTADEAKAADVFVEYWERCTGHRPQVMTNSSSGPAVFIGSAVPEVWMRSDPAADLGEDGVAMKFHQGDGCVQLAVYGSAQKGTLYAVYEFFERYLGVRWLAPDAVTVPPAPDRIADVDYRYAPPFEFRATALAPGADPDAHRIAWYNYGLHGHSLYDLLPPEQYFAEHPEYYSEIHGKRIAPVGIDWTMPDVAAVHHAQLGQLCMTNPDVAAALAAALEVKISEKPDATVWSVSQMDWGNACRCSQCAALVDQEGTDAAPFLVGVNRVAEFLEEKHPNLRLQTYAYTWTRKPPKTIRPHKNVLVQLCTFECDFARPLTDPDSVVNRAFMRDFKDWRALGATLLIYDYPVNCRNPLRPSPTDAVLGPNMRTFLAGGVLGVYEQGRGGKGTAFGLLKPYVIAKALWNPTLAVDPLCREFIDGYYGKSAPYIFDYLMLVRDTLREQGVQMFLFDSCGWLTQDFVAKAESLFKEALAAAESDIIKQRVAVEYAQVLYGAALAQPEAVYERDQVIVRRASRMEPQALLQHLAAIGTMNANDGWPITPEAMAPDIVSAPEEQRLPLVTLENDFHQIWVVPGHFGSVLRWHDKTRDRELLKGYESFGALPGSWQDWEDRNTLGERSVAREYNVTEQTPQSVTIEAATESGVTVRRTMRFAADPHVLEVELTLTNTGTAPAAPKIKLHPEFHAQRVNVVPEIWVQKATGWTQMNSGVNPLEIVRGEFVIPETATAWAFFVKEDNYGLLNEFRREELSRMLYFYNTGPGPEQINLELFPRDEPLAPGESRIVHCSYRIITEPPAPNPQVTLEGER